ncbi:MAG: hypothetical protein ACUVQV_06040 [Dissulfurimicrobium sp.]|uniref:hypothetical protein n=1 Tax=Dissulfurimicrobium sp. TaxID=2022436 RepID=UPI004049D80E
MNYFLGKRTSITASCKKGLLVTSNKHDGYAQTQQQHHFSQTIADYPLVEAISQNVIKHTVVPDAASRGKLVERQSAKYTEKYADCINQQRDFRICLRQKQRRTGQAARAGKRN